MAPPPRVVLLLAAVCLSCTSTPPVGLDGGQDAGCGPDERRCAAGCVDLERDDANCGACGVACGAGNACAGGLCYPRTCTAGDCGAGRVCVSEVCVATACFGLSCEPNEVCARGACLTRTCGGATCAPTQACVDGGCVEAACVGVACPQGSLCLGGLCQLATCSDGLRNGTETDVDCGGRLCAPCGVDRACAAAADCVTQRCVAGVCARPPGADAGPPDGGPVDAGTDAGQPDAGTVDAGCATGLTACPRGCVSTLLSDLDCGTCGNACATGTGCAGGACYPTTCMGQPCAPGRVCVTDVCIDKACFGVACGATSVCAQGVCYPRSCGTQTCAVTHACVNGACVDATCVGVSCPPGAACQAGTCRLDTCGDGALNGGEADVDCGGAFCARCAPGQSCRADGDCASRRCADGFCQAPTCTDGLRNGGEGDVDCGGACPGCASGRTCSQGPQCASGACDGGLCQTATCTDRLHNGAETDVDCGGGACPTCDGGQGCDAGSDCASATCAQGRCLPPTCFNLVRDGTETDVDCGGPCPLCGTGRRCDAGVQCQSRVCGAAGTCQGPSCTDRQLNGAETDVDCGGDGGCLRCTPGLRCRVGADCNFSVCTAGLCAFPSCTDGLRNGTESDVDCGGASCPRCPGGRSCDAGTDCLAGTCAAGVCGPNPVFGSRPLLTLPTGTSTKDLAVGDFDGDGHRDIAFVNAGSYDLSIYWGRGNGTFQTGQSVGVPAAYSNSTMGLAAADFTGDGLDDLAINANYFTAEYGGVMLLASAGSRNWRAPVLRSVITTNGYRTTCRRAWAGNFNADALPDLVTGGVRYGGLSGMFYDGAQWFFPSGGAGGFSSTVELTGGTGSHLSGADVNADTKLDLLSHSGEGTAVHVRLGDGLGGFAAPFTMALGAGNGDVVAGRLDSDTAPDLIIGLDSSNRVAVARGVGDGTFLAATTYPAPLATGLAVTDVDGDGTLDVVAAGQGLLVLRGAGDGTLRPYETVFGSVRLTYLALADFDEDGKLDVAAVANNGSGYVILANP